MRNLKRKSNRRVLSVQLFFYCCGVKSLPLFWLPSLNQTNSLHLKISGWKVNFLLGWSIFKAKMLVSGKVYFVRTLAFAKHNFVRDVCVFWCLKCFV